MSTPARTRQRLRTTVRLELGLLDQAKREAAKGGETLTALIEDGVRLAIAQRRKPRKLVDLPASTTGGGLLPGIDLNNSVQLWDILDGLEDPSK
jgi:hypothetical protein